MTSLIAVCLALALSMQGTQGPREDQPVQDLAGYRLAELKLTNASPLNSEFLKAVFSISNGDPYDAKHLRETLGKIRMLYMDMGHIDFVYNPHLDIDHSEKTVSCSFEFIPGTRYRINRIHLLGARSSEEENEIKGALNLLKEKNIFSPSALYGSIWRLSELLDAKSLALKGYEFKRSSDH